MQIAREKFSLKEILLYSLIIIFIIIIIYFKWAYTYWKRRKIPYLNPLFFLGSTTIKEIYNQDYIGLNLKEKYSKLKSEGHKHCGLYLFYIPKYMALDPKIIQHIMQKDFEKFTERNFYYNEKSDPLSANLFALGGKRWKNLRTHLNPVFTSSKLKIMFDVLLQNGYQLSEAIQGKTQIDARDVSISYSINVIGSCIFGIDCNTFKNPNDEFKRQGIKIFNFSSLFRKLIVTFAFTHQNLARKLGIGLFDKESANFFTNIVTKIVNFRKMHDLKRKDMIDLLMNLKNQYGDAATLNELAAQVFIFFAAGFETSSTTLALCLYELSINTNMQEKVRTEIKNVLDKYDGKITYDAVMELNYMQSVVDETLRKYPPISFVTRKCEQDFHIPDTDLVLEKGIEIIISILGLHRDPDYFPEPEKFEPDRFSADNKYKIQPFTYLPFGGGPRICIGIRFAIMKIKVALTILLMHYSFLINPKTDNPIQYESYSFTLLPKNGIYLDVKNI